MTNNNTKKKYEVTNNVKKLFWGRTIILHQIKALVDIPEHNVKNGDLGGWIESEANLSHEGKCWINPSGHVFDTALVSEDAVIGQQQFWKPKNDAYVHDHACVKGSAVVWDPADIRGMCVIDGHAHVEGAVGGHAHVTDYAHICGSVNGNAVVKDYANIFTDATICGEAVVVGYSRIKMGVFRKGEVSIPSWISDMEWHNMRIDKDYQ